MKNVCFMHIQGGKLYGTIIMGQVLWDVLMFPNGMSKTFLTCKNSHIKKVLTWQTVPFKNFSFFFFFFG
jgi:hypothetical protein